MQLASSKQGVYFSLSGIRLISDLLCSIRGETKMFWDRVSVVYDLFGKVYELPTTDFVGWCFYADTAVSVPVRTA